VFPIAKNCWHSYNEKYYTLVTKMFYLTKGRTISRNLAITSLYQRTVNSITSLHHRTVNSITSLHHRTLNMFSCQFQCSLMYLQKFWFLRLILYWVVQNIQSYLLLNTEIVPSDLRTWRSFHQRLILCHLVFRRFLFQGLHSEFSFHIFGPHIHTYG
jgi:hypothetical protein